MKRLTTLLLAMCMVIGSAVSASAIEVQISGVWDTNFAFNDNLGFDDEDVNDHFLARSRFRPQVEFIASENLRGVLQLQIGSIRWGEEATGGQLDTTTATAKVRRAYIDWNVADTTLNIKMGLHHMGFPSAVRGNPFFAGNVAGITAGVGINDNVTLTALWARPFVSDGNGSYKDNESDIFGLVADFNFDQFSISPWVAYANVGNLSGHWRHVDGYSGFYNDGNRAAYYNNIYNAGNDDSDVFAAGIAVKVNPTERLSIGLDAAYATSDNDGRKGGSKVVEGDGYFMALSVDYSADWGTPGLFAWYSSGDDADEREERKWGRMMSLGCDDGVAFTRMGFMGSYGHGVDTVVSATGAGTWGVGLQVADVSFIEKLSHTLRVAYYQGTNKEKAGSEKPANLFGEVLYLTEKDHAFEVNFDHKYQIYENFTAVFELGWIYMDLDKKGFEYGHRNGEVDKNAYNAQVILRYAF